MSVKAVPALSDFLGFRGFFAPFRQQKLLNRYLDETQRFYFIFSAGKLESETFSDPGDSFKIYLLPKKAGEKEKRRPSFQSFLSFNLIFSTFVIFA